MEKILVDEKSDVDPKDVTWRDYVEHLRERLKHSDRGLRTEIYSMVIIRLLFEVVHLLVKRKE